MKLARGHVGKVTRGHGVVKDATLSRPYPRQIELPLLGNKGAVGCLAPELINIDDVFANAGDGDF